MSIEKLNALRTTVVNQQQQVSKPSEPQKIQDKKLSESAKYMIGATALAGAIAVGIIGHRQGWWRKAASQLTSNDTTPKPTVLEPAETTEKSASGFDIIKMQLDNGYALFCRKTGKVFNKIYDPENKEYRYLFSRQLENGNKIDIRKENISVMVNGRLERVPQTTHSLINKDGKVIYETSYEKGSNFRPEIILDYDTMTAYQVRKHKNTTAIIKTPFETDGITVMFKEESPMDYTEFEKIRRKTFEDNLPPSHYAIANNLTSKINRALSLPKNSDGNTIIRLKENEFEIRTPNNKKQCIIKLGEDGKIEEYRKFDENGVSIEYGENYSDFCTFKGPNGKVEGSYEECGLNKLEELIKDTTGIL